MSVERVLLSFKSQTCQPCRRLAEVLDTLQPQGIRVITVDVTQDQALVQKYQVMSVPTLVGLVDDRVVAQQVGFMGRAPVEALLEQLKTA